MTTPPLTPVFTDASDIRDKIHAKAVAALSKVFPVDLRGRTLEVKNVTVDKREYSPDEQKHANLTGGTLLEPVRATLVLKSSDGKVIDQTDKFTLAHLPYFTERHTVIIDGNEHQIANMIRRKPGVYTERSENGELSTFYNLSKGRNFSLVMKPEKGTFYMNYGTSNLPLYPVLKALGTDHTTIANHLGADVAAVNAAAYAGKEHQVINSLYDKLAMPGMPKPTTHEGRVDFIRQKFQGTAIGDGSVALATLGKAHTTVTPVALLDGTARLLETYNGKKPVDDADSLTFKTFHSIDDFLGERVALAARPWSTKARFALHGKDQIRGNLKPAPFSDSIKKFITTSPLAAVPTGINPIELMDHAVKVTSLGEGGIPSERAIPYDARMTHATHYGALDPVRTPESGHAGVDIRASIAAMRDDQGNLYTQVRDRSGKIIALKSGDIPKHVIAFPHQALSGMVDVMDHGVTRKVPASKVEYQFPHEAHALSPATSLLPMLRNMQGNRAIMGSKMQTQAVPLVDREAPLVQVKSHLPDGSSFESVYGKMIVPTAPVSGTIHKIENGWIYLKPNGVKSSDENAGLIKIPYQTNFPFPSKTYLHHDLNVKPGDSVKAGQTLGESNYTRNGTLALGKNLSVAYVAYHGMNSNDAVVISEGAAKKLTSEHMYREIYQRTNLIELSKSKHQAYFGSKHTPAQYANLDADGIIKKGSTVRTKDLLVAGLAKVQVTGANAMLGKISKALTTPYKEVNLTWEHGAPGEVVDVVRSTGQIAILIKTRESMQIGDKLAGRWGNKGVVSQIVPDHQMLQDSSGNPVDVLMTSAGVVSRINPGQIIETAVAKVALKTGKPIVYDNSSSQNAVKWAKNLLKEHGVSDKEHLYDPITGRTLVGHDGKGVMVGPQHIFKLFKSTDTNFSGHGIGPYDINEQPLKVGGDESAKAIGKMEFDALVSHDARALMREASTIKGQKNEEFWRAKQLGAPLPTPKPSFAWNKFTAMLEGAGVKVQKTGSKLSLIPLTDRDILARSTGPIVSSKTLAAKNLKPEAGGLFDISRTGGPGGNLYSHIPLHEPLPNPVFEEPIRRLLGMTQAQYKEHLSSKGGQWFKEQLAAINVPTKLQQLRDQMRRASGATLNDVVKQIKFLEALQKNKQMPQDAYILSNVPVIPPIFRPISPMPNDPSQLMVSDANKLYGHLMDANNVLKTTALPSDVPKHRDHLYNAVGAVFGTHEVDDEELRGQSVRGFISSIAGANSPKSGYFHRKLLTKTQDVSGRGTAVPDVNLGMDQIGIPEDMLWKMLDKHLVTRLTRTGYAPLDARKLVTDRAPSARAALAQEIKDTPFFFNRAPTLHRFSVVGAYAVPVQGKTLRVNPLVEKGLNLDYDGDTLQVHAPVTNEGVSDVKRITLSNQLLSDQSRDKLMVIPQHEAIIGITHASKAVNNNERVQEFATREDLLAAYRKGEVSLNSPVRVMNPPKTASYDAEDAVPFRGQFDVLASFPPAYVVGDP